MRHLFSHTVYDGVSRFGDDPYAFLGSVGADGIELPTAFDEPDRFYRGLVETVHLPYATDWMAAWEGRPFDMDADMSLYYMFGRTRGDVADNVRRAIDAASSVSPSYGVFHATDGPLDELCSRTHSHTSEKVLSEFSEMINTVASGFPGGEPPFRILFENLWWPGLRLVDESDFRYLSRRIEFENWGICLDTGHLMNCLPGIRTEFDGIEALLDIFNGYSRDLIDSIYEVHFHWSASWEYRSSFQERRPCGSLSDFISSVYPHISKIDQHMPFSDPSCSELLEILDPEIVTHELPGSASSPEEDFRQQRALLR